MILMHEPSPVGNIIRLVIGKETEVALALHGCAVINLTEILDNVKKFDVGNPNVLLSISKVDSEVDTLNMLRQVQTGPPYQSPLVVIAPKLNDESVSPPANTNNIKDNNMESAPVKIVVGTCNYCKASNVNVITSAVTKPVCNTCFVLNMGLAGQPIVRKAKKSIKSKDCDES